MEIRQCETHSPAFQGQQRTQVAKRLFLSAYEGNFAWQVAKSCRMAGIGRATYYRWLSEDLVFRNECKTVEQMCYDYAREKLFAAAINGNMRAVITFLKLYHPDYVNTRSKVSGLNPLRKQYVTMR